LELPLRALSEAVEKSGVTGASFAYWDGGALHAAVAGVRNSVTRDPVTPDTAMHIGSISKLLNTVLMMQLVDDGLIALDDLVSRHLPELRLRDAAALSRITCAMLVNHTSGIDGDGLPDRGPDRERIVDAIERCAELGQVHAPGGGPSYCNIGTVIAGYLAQKLRDTSWYTLIKSRIYEPLGLQHSIADLTDLPRARHSIGDLTDPATGELVQTTRAFLPLSWAPAGATLMMSASDLVTFARTLLNGGVAPNGVRLLSAASAALMAAPTIAMIEPAGWQWGLGWMILPGGLLSHSGGGPGVASVLYAHPGSGRVLALLTNCDRHDALKPSIVDPILESWIGVQTPAPARKPDRIDPSVYAGSYENSLFRAQMGAEGDSVVARLVMKHRVYDTVTEKGFPQITLHPVSEHVFEGAALVPGLPNMGFHFVHPDANGRMQALGWMGRLLPRVA
jgi:CubicO group peptidase (beta-lactamase class C family)